MPLSARPEAATVSDPESGSLGIAIVALLILLPLSLLAPVRSASAVGIDWVDVPGPGNACDEQATGCFGAVATNYQISRTEVTNAQYAEFLNAKAASDPFGLYNPSMASGQGGIVRSGSPGSYVYSTIVGRGEMPVVFVSFFDALRFANWLHNGQGNGDTESGAYTLLGGTATPSNGATVVREPGATVVVPLEDEWYKAAYYDADSDLYYDYPAGSDDVMTCQAGGLSPNAANCLGGPGGLVAVGSYAGSAGPNGTFDQGGNVYEWTETLVAQNRRLRGGSWSSSASTTGAASGSFTAPATESQQTGMRVATPSGGAAVPASSSVGLGLLGGALAVLGGRRIRRTATEP
ncbi:MAG: SUMF1/EgtB/PvdO family nonheme iron enzyme [Myxococcota bacterium]